MRHISICVGSMKRISYLGRREHFLIISGRHVNVENRWKLLLNSTQQKEIQVNRRGGDDAIYLHVFYVVV